MYVATKLQSVGQKSGTSSTLSHLNKHEFKFSIQHGFGCSDSETGLFKLLHSSVHLPTYIRPSETSS